MYTTFTYSVHIGNSYNEAKKDWSIQDWRQTEKTFLTSSNLEEIEEYADNLKEQETKGNVKYISKCVHDNKI